MLMIALVLVLALIVRPSRIGGGPIPNLVEGESGDRL